ncbi:MAG: hypothetical protein IPH16_20560 [Haliscomenobacter sp.]|nr:hypothetical protein [Haliscomenobacter sp.]
MKLLKMIRRGAFFNGLPTPYPKKGKGYPAPYRKKECMAVSELLKTRPGSQTSGSCQDQPYAVRIRNP